MHAPVLSTAYPHVSYRPASSKRSGSFPPTRTLSVNRRGHGQHHSALSYTATICQPIGMTSRAILFGNPTAEHSLDIRGAKPFPRLNVLNIRDAKHVDRLNTLNIRAGTAPR